MLPLVALVLAVGSPRARQDTVRIPPEPVCSSCRIEVTRVALLGAFEDSAAPRASGPINVARDSAGRLYVAPMIGFSSVGVYDSRGRYLTSIGRTGSGPGEFRLALEVKVLRGDTVLVVDRSLRRLTFLTPRFEIIRTVALEGAPEGILRLPDGRFIGHWRSSTASRIGRALHVYAPDGKIDRSFPSTTAVRPGSYDQHRQFTVGGGAVWAVRANQYDIEQWNYDGTLQRVLSADRPWFEPWTSTPPEPANVARRKTWLESIRYDSSGYLWLTFHVAQKDWRPAPGVSRQAGREDPGLTEVEREKFEDTIVEVIDPRTSRLHASAVLEGIYYGYLNGGGNLYARHVGRTTTARSPFGKTS